MLHKRRDKRSGKHRGRVERTAEGHPCIWCAVHGSPDALREPMQSACVVAAALCMLLLCLRLSGLRACAVISGSLNRTFYVQCSLIVGTGLC